MMCVAISQRRNINKHGATMDALESSYVDYFERLGVLLVPIPNSSINLKDYFERFSIKGIILTGGNMINPSLYGGQETSPDISDQRDATERMILDMAIEKNLPVLGICRGCQFINVYFGGKLIGNINNGDKKIKHIASSHEVEIVHDSLKKILGEKITVNSYHNQSITQGTLSGDLEVFAKADDGTVEGLCHRNLPIAGMIWHPERESPNEGANNEIINLFIKGELFWKKR